MEVEFIDGQRIFVIHDFLSLLECERQIDRSEAAGFETFKIDGEVFHGFRDNARVLIDDADLANSLWQSAAEHLPPKGIEDLVEQQCPLIFRSDGALWPQHMGCQALICVAWLSLTANGYRPISSRANDRFIA